MSIVLFCFFFNDTATTEIYTLSLHDALPISIHSKIAPRAGEKRRSLKSLENLVARHIGPELAHKYMGPLFGIYDLRHADAHLASSSLDETLELIGVNRDSPFVLQGFALLNACVTSLWFLGDALQEALLPHSD